MITTEYKKNDTDFEIREQGGYKKIEFNSPYEEAFFGFKKSTFYLFEPEKKPFKGDLVFIHGIGNGNIPYLLWYARYFKSKGYRTSFLIMPYHLDRTPEGQQGGEPFYSAEPNECMHKFHYAVKDIRKTIDILELFGNYDGGKLYLMGMSFGGIIGTMALALDKRIKKGVLLVAGGNWRLINFHSPYTLKIKNEVETFGNSYGCDGEKKCAEYFRKDSVLYVKNNFKKIDDIFTGKHVGCYVYDPLSFAPFVDQQVLFIRAAFDRIMPKQSSLELLSLLNNSIYKTIPTGHKSSYFMRRHVGRMVLKFLDK